MLSFASDGGDGDGYVCMDSSGSYNVQIPEDAPAGMYSIKVTLTGDATVYGCTNAFQVTLPEDSAGNVVVVGEPSMEDVEVDYAAVLSPGSAFTARWAYDDGTGGGKGTFDVNLNACGDDGSCDGTG